MVSAARDTWPVLGASASHAAAAVSLADAEECRVVNDDGSSSVSLLQRLGILHHSRGDFAGARSHEEWSQRLASRLLGAEHPATLTSASNLAATLLDLGDLVGARAQLERIVPLFVRVLGADHPSTRNSMIGLQIVTDRQAQERLRPGTGER